MEAAIHPRRRGRIVAGRAFSLVELLMVITLIAILSGLLFPALARARAKAQQCTCLNNLRQLGTAAHLYAGDWDDLLPRPTATPDDGASWFYAIDPYLLNIIPAANASPAQKTAPVKQDPVWHSLSAESRMNWRTIKMNKKLLGSRTQGPSVTSAVDGWAPSWRRLGSIQKISRTVLLFDGRCEEAGSLVDRARFDGWEVYAARRHDNGANMVFTDNHAEWRRETSWQNDQTSLEWWVDP